MQSGLCLTQENWPCVCIAVHCWPIHSPVKCAGAGDGVVLTHAGWCVCTNNRKGVLQCYTGDPRQGSSDVKAVITPAEENTERQRSQARFENVCGFLKYTQPTYRYDMKQKSIHVSTKFCKYLTTQDFMEQSDHMYN